MAQLTIVRRPICTRVAGAVVFAAIAVAMAGASAAGSSPRSPFPGFLLDRGRYTAFDAPEAVFATLPYGINDRGQIVGRYNDASSEQGFLRDKAGRFTNIKIRGARSAWAVNINNRGRIVGIYSENTPFVKAPGGKRHGFLLARGKVTRIDVPGAVETGASRINDRGQVAPTSTPTASSTDTCGRGVGSPPSTCPASPRHSPTTSTIGARSWVTP